MLMKRTLLISGLATIAFLLAALATLYGDTPFRDEPSADEIKIEAVEVDESPVVLRMTVRNSGMVAVSEQVVESARLPFSDFSAESLALYHNGDPVPFYVDSRNETNETLYFYAEAITDTLAAPAVYLLKSETGVAMRVRDALPTGPGIDTGDRLQRWEQNLNFLPSAFERDPWLGPLIYAPNSIEIALDGIVATEDSAELTAHVWSNNQSAADPDHHLQISLNGTQIADQFWDGITSKLISAPIEQGVLQSSDNILTLAAPGDSSAAGEAIYLDWIELAYTGELVLRGVPLRFRSAANNLHVRGATATTFVFDISNPTEPTLLTNLQSDKTGISFASEGLTSEYLVLEPNQTQTPELNVAPLWETALRNISSADYIAIVPSSNEFAKAVQPLVDLRQSQGLTVQVVSLDQIYDEFGFGRKTPQAIKDFLTFARRNWVRTPRYVLLVGDASYDVNRFADGDNQNLLPTHVTFSSFDSVVGDDSWVVDDGDPTTVDMAIGRFPVQTVEQLSIMVKKTVGYASAENFTWRNRSLLVSDDETYFATASEELAESLSASNFNNQKLAINQNENIHDAIIGALNQGVGLLNYIGHGGIRVWGDERVLSVEDADALTNWTRLPIFTTFTCLNGYFQHPQEEALAEALLRAKGGGIVAAIAPAGPSLLSQQIQLSDLFFSNMLDQPTLTLGELLQVMKTRSNENPNLIEASQTFNLLGDPALHFPLPEN
ncbi:MAG TPA: hypothetical protein ENJ56_00665 [Anaerolineae bacterium]|nr:hypothetical protein [Anaerolineae bacterium]